MQEIIELVSNLGFAAVVAFWSLRQLKDTNEKHYDEVIAISKSLDKNTEVINRLCDRFDMMDGGDEYGNK